MKEINRIFLNWNRPFLDSALEYLVKIADHSCGFIDLSGIRIFSTVGRANRRLLEKLYLYAESRDLGLAPPQFISISALYQNLLPTHKFIQAETAQLIFFEILKDAGKNDFLNLFPSLAEDVSELQLLEKSKFLAETYNQMTRNSIDAESSIESVIKSGLVPNEDTWQDLKTIFKRYKELLETRGYIDSIAALRLITPCNDSLLLLGTFDLSPIIAETIKRGFSNIQSLIFAPEDIASAFDNLGCLISDFWEGRSVDASKLELKICSSPQSQLHEIFKSLKQIEQDTAASFISIACLEPKFDKLVQSFAISEKLHLHRPSGNSFLLNEFSKIILSSLRMIELNDFPSLSALLVFDPISNLLSDKGQALEKVNLYRESALQHYLNDTLPGKVQEITSILSELEQVLKPLKISEQSAGAWSKSIYEFAKQIYKDDIKQQNLEVLEEIATLLDNLGNTSLNIATLLALLEQRLGQSYFDDQLSSENRETIDILGWLELTFDDAPYLFLSGLNEGFVPAKFNSSHLLPDSVRKVLNLETEASRLARDSYIFETIINSKANLKLFAAKLSLEDSALMLSRLLLKGDAFQLASLIKRYYQHQVSETGEQLEQDNSFAGGYRDLYLTGLKPKRFEAYFPSSLSVSALVNYKKCPYYFYLSNVLRLRPCSPEAREISASAFGNIIHEVLADFANSEAASLVDPDEIDSFLKGRLKLKFQNLYGNAPYAEVLVQEQFLLNRLRLFSYWQAKQIKHGWRIQHSELDFEPELIQLKTSAGAISVSGRIDRIDCNKDLNQYRIIDYKTGSLKEASKKKYSPEELFWHHPQLSTYKFYLQQKTKGKEIQTAYLALVDDHSESGIKEHRVELDQGVIDTAITEFKMIAAQIVQQNFWPALEKNSSVYELSNIYKAIGL